MGGTSTNVSGPGGWWVVVRRLEWAPEIVGLGVAPASGRTCWLVGVGFWHTVGSWDNRTGCPPCITFVVVCVGVVVPGC